MHHCTHVHFRAALWCVDCRWWVDPGSSGKGSHGGGNESPLPASLTLFAGSLACAHVRLTPPTLPTPTPCRLQGDREKPHS